MVELGRKHRGIQGRERSACGLGGWGRKEGGCVFYNSSMQQSIGILSDVYNLIGGVGPAAGVGVSAQAIEQFRQIYLLVNELVTSECMHPRSIFEELCLFINKEEEVFGPRKFRRMIDTLAAIIIQFVASRLRSANTDAAVLCLTYFARYCHRHFTPAITLLLALLHALAHFQKNTLEIAQNYISQARQLLRAIPRDQFGDNCAMIVELLEGIAWLRRENLSKARFIFSEAIGRLTQRIHAEQTRSRRVTRETASFFTVATYYLAQAHEQLGSHDLAAYHFTQCLDFATAHLPDHHALSRHLQSTRCLAPAAIKLGRVENKIESIKSLHFRSRSTHAHLKENKANPPTTTPQFKICKRTQLKVSEGAVRRELENILVLEEGSQARLKKKTVRELQAEQQEKERKIESFEQQMEEFEQEKEEIARKYPNEQYSQDIEEKRAQLAAIKRDISGKVWGVVSSLRPTRRIAAYLLGFTAALAYEKNNNFLKFLYSQVSFRSHLKLYSILRKIRSRLLRQLARKLTIANVQHQIELLTHKTNASCHIKLYQIEKGRGLNLEQEVSAEVFEALKQQPFCFSFHLHQQQLVPFKEYLLGLPQWLLMRARLFGLKLRRKAQMRRRTLLLQKREVNITFGTYYNQLKYVVLVTSREAEGGRYQHCVERIDCGTHRNPDYNIRIRERLETQQLEMCELELSELVTGCILAQKARHVHLITRIQQMFRVRLAHHRFMRLKDVVHVNTTIIRRAIYSLIVNGPTRTFYVEHLDSKFPKAVLPNANFYNLSFLHKIRAELVACEDCQTQMAIINKFFRLRNFAYKFIKKSQEVKLDTKFSTKFKKSLCFAKVMRQYLYRGKLIEGRMMYMLTVKDFGAFPRPYLLRVFTIEHKTLYSVDCEQVIFNSEKIYLENNLDRLNHFLDIQDHRRVAILDGPYKPSKVKRQNSKSTLVSNFTFGSGEDFLRERKSRLGSRLGNSRDSTLNTRNKKNSINFKMRHKSALKQKDILLIKKWIEDSKEDSSISESEESSTA